MSQVEDHAGSAAAGEPGVREAGAEEDGFRPAAPPASTRFPAAFAARLRSTSAPVLMLDYDGTVAPFRVRREEARPWPGVTSRLQQIASVPGTLVFVISGREAETVAAFLHPFRPYEIWGVHGLERLGRDGRVTRCELAPSVCAGLDEARRRGERAGFADQLEEKHGALAWHWRGLSVSRAERIRGWAEGALPAVARSAGLEFRPFDGGIELRARGPDKGTAVRSILASSPEDAVAAYLGDDLTDEDAFLALRDRAPDRGLGVLVRGEARSSAAALWVRPPEELMEVFDHWLTLTREKR